MPNILLKEDWHVAVGVAVAVAVGVVLDVAVAVAVAVGVGDGVEVSGSLPKVVSCRAFSELADAAITTTIANAKVRNAETTT